MRQRNFEPVFSSEFRAKKYVKKNIGLNEVSFDAEGVQICNTRQKTTVTTFHRPSLNCVLIGKQQLSCKKQHVEFVVPGVLCDETLRAKLGVPGGTGLRKFHRTCRGTHEI